MPQINRRSRQFRDLFDNLPKVIREDSAVAFRKFLENPDHPGLHRKTLQTAGRGSHLPGSVSVRINRRYRSIYIEENGVCVWYWTGSHTDYNKFTGSPE